MRFELTTKSNIFQNNIYHAMMEEEKPSPEDQLRFENEMKKINL